MNKTYSGLLIFAIALIISPFASAGISDVFNKMTGKVTNQPVNLSISVGGGNAPQIMIYPSWMTDVSGGLNEGPISTLVTIKFQASDAEGYANINDSTAMIKFTKSGEQTRQAMCSRITGESIGNYANYTCDVTMWWFDGAGNWNINASISDLNNNYEENSTEMFSVGATTGFVSSPTALTWPQINPGAINQPANEMMTLNNTGNIQRNIAINSTNLYGETDDTKALYAGNFSVDISAGCGGTAMNRYVETQVISATLPKGNYTLNDGTGQEQLYFCLKKAGEDLTQQIYSTTKDGAWTTKITA